ncbi:MAG: guanosine monophosphate reductase [Nanoarchaeota archaeon]|nr:guanosine monophosphate reductase [Nanoarchaeota archaeon]
MARIIGRGHSFQDVLIVPRYNKIRSRKEVDFKTKVTKNYEINIPLVVANMDTTCESKMAIAIGKIGGLGVIHRFLTIKKQAEEVRKVKNQNLICAAAIGIKDFEERIFALEKSGVNILVLDIAHGHSKYAGKIVDYVKEKYPHLDIMAGNIATKDAADYFLSKGADAIKVGIGPGSMCTTRIMAGAGIPQLTAIMDAYEATQGRIPICADGGIMNPGDLTKALGAGANTVMSGSIFAGTDETPGKIVKKKGKKYKMYRGMASYDATLRKTQIQNGSKEEIISIEGEKTFVPYKGPVKEIIKKFLGGLASGMTYMGAKEMEELIGKADFIEISNAGIKESGAHGLRE